jgi:O-antigen/teichoic acid export membrane protein
VAQGRIPVTGEGSIFNRMLRNFGVVIRGRALAGIFSVIATGLMANALPAAEFGLVVLIHTYVMVIRGALNFRTFEAVVRFGIPLNDSGNTEGLRSLLRSTMLVDYSAALLATLVGIAAASLAGQFLHWEAGTVHWVMGYCLVILATANGTPNGILRVYNRFDALGVQYTVAPALRFISVGIAWLMDATMPVFIIAWGSAFALGHIYMSARGLLELRRNVDARLWQGFRRSDVTKRESDFWNFVGVVYWQTNIDLLPKHVSVLLAGGLLGPASAGLFRLAREVSTILAQPALVLREVLFPDLTRSFHADDGGLQSVPFKTAIIAGGAGLLVVALSIVFGGSLLSIVGTEYVPAAPLLSLLLLAAAYAMGRAATILKIHVWGIVTYLAAFFLLTPLLGLTGPGLAAILASLLAMGLTVRLVSGLAGQESS